MGKKKPTVKCRDCGNGVHFYLQGYYMKPVDDQLVCSEGDTPLLKFGDSTSEGFTEYRQVVCAECYSTNIKGEKKFLRWVNSKVDHGDYEDL